MDTTEQNSNSVIYLADYKKQKLENTRQILIDFVNRLTPEKTITAETYLEHFLTLLGNFYKHIPKEDNYALSVIDDIYCFAEEYGLGQETWVYFEQNLIILLEQNQKLKNLITISHPPLQIVFMEIIDGLYDNKFIRGLEKLYDEHCKQGQEENRIRKEKQEEIEEHWGKERERRRNIYIEKYDKELFSAIEDGYYQGLNEYQFGFIEDYYEMMGEFKKVTT